MKRGEAGFTLVEVIIASIIATMVAGSAAYLIIQTVRNTRRTDDHLTAVRELEDAASRINSDARISEQAITTDLTPPEFVIFKWTEWGYSQPTVYHSITYTIEDLSGNIGNLVRTHQDTSGVNEQTVVAGHVYYNPADTANTTKVAIESGVLTFRVTTSLGASQVSREYGADSRTSLFH